MCYAKFLIESRLCAFEFNKFVNKKPPEIFRNLFEMSACLILSLFRLEHLKYQARYIVVDSVKSNVPQIHTLLSWWTWHGTYTPSELLLFSYCAWIVLWTKVCTFCLKVDVMISTKSWHITKLDIRVYNVYISEILYTVIQLRIRSSNMYHSQSQQKMRRKITWTVSYSIGRLNAGKYNYVFINEWTYITWKSHVYCVLWVFECVHECVTHWFSSKCFSMSMTSYNGINRCRSVTFFTAGSRPSSIFKLSLFSFV